jgi:alpha-L-fucosidase 2
MRYILALAALGSCCASAVAMDSTDAVVSRSDIFVGQPNILPSQAMAIGNGRLGAAVWAADGMTIQLNRSDTLPGRLSPGQVLLPGLKPMIADRGFRAKLHLFDGVWTQAGGGMHASVTVDHDSDRVIVEVDGANPDREQTVILKLWEPRLPTPVVRGGMVMLSERWVDDRLPGASGLPFGSLAAVHVDGRQLHSASRNRCQAEIHFKPRADGTYRVIIAAPAFDGSEDPESAALKSLNAKLDPASSIRWWHDLWHRTDMVIASSPDGRAEYFEALRTLFIYYSAAQSGGSMPGSQAGIADLFSAVRDQHYWDPAAFWLWNLRMQVAANLDAGLPQLNEPLFALYRNRLPTMQQWTRARLQGREGICLPETMRFNGVGVEFESQAFRAFPIITHSCDADWTAVANARTLSSGAELGLWIWDTYLKTEDRDFLAANYPLMAEAAKFLLSYQKLGADGLLHTDPSNAHETQTDVKDPTTDLAAIRALYPATIAAAQLLGRDAELSARLAAAVKITPELPLIEAIGTPDRSLPPAALSPGDVIAPSYDFSAPARNSENIGLEPLWPYGLIGPDSALFGIAQRTYAYRPFRSLATWSNDPIHAARLGFGAEVVASLDALTQLYQTYPNGLANAGDDAGEFYIEQMAIVAAALSEVIAQDQVDYLVVAAALPPHWSMQGSAFVRGNANIRVYVSDGQLSEFELIARAAHRFRIKNPWPGHVVFQSIQGSPSAPAQLYGEILDVTADAGSTHHFQPDRSTPSRTQTLPEVHAGPKSLGRASIGLGEPCCAPPDTYNPESDRTIGRRL